MGWRIRIPLWALLPGLAVSFVALGAVAAGAVGISSARGYLARQADNNLSVCAGSVLSQRFEAGPTSGQAPSGGCDIELLSTSGQLLTPPAQGQGPGPAIPAEPSWLVAHTARPVTVPGAGAGGSWRVLLEPVHYRAQRILFVYGTQDVQYMISGRAARGPSGLLVVTTGLAGLGQLTARVATAAGAVLILLAAAGLAVTRAVLRPLRAAPQLAATQLAAPQFEATQFEATQFAALQPALSGISGQMAASRDAEAAARRSTAEMAEHLSEVSQELRTSVSIVRGFAESCRQPGKAPPAAGDPMVRRATDEITRIETLVARLDEVTTG
jgi:signal transduction histidine kinase